MGGCCSWMYDCLKSTLFVRCGCSCNPNHEPVGKVNRFRRSCTDLPFFFLYIASWAMIAAIFAIAIDRGGNPQLLIKGVDFKDRICGVDAGVKDQPYAAWPQIFPPYESGFGPRDLFKIKICVQDCSQTLTDNRMYIPYPSRNLTYYCAPDLAINSTAVTALAEYDRFNEVIARSVGDLQIAWDVILGMAFVAMVFTIIYCFVAKYVAGPLVFMSLGSVLIGGACLAYVLYSKAVEIEAVSVSSNQAQAMRTASYVAITLTILFLFIIGLLRERIYIAVEIIKVTSDAAYDAWPILFTPFFTFAIACVYLVWWFYVALYIFSVSVQTEQELPISLKVRLVSNNFIDREWDDSMRYFGMFHFFHLLWNIQFISYFLYLVLAGVLAEWYFSRYDADGKKIRGSDEDQFPNFAVFRSLWRAIRYNLGTIAFGSFLIAVIQFIRYVLKYIQSKLIFENPKDGAAQFAKACLALTDCILKVIEVCVDQINKHGFIYCAIYGEPFCASSCSAFNLIWRNLGRFAALSFISDFLVIVGKLAVSFGCVGIAAIIFSTSDRYAGMHSLILPCLIVFTISYLVSSIFFMVYETCIDTIFFCFLVDEELNKNTGNMYASKGLRSVVDAHRLESERLAARKKSTKALFQEMKSKKTVL